MLAVNNALLAFLALNVEIGSELDRAVTALGQLVELGLFGDGGNVLLLILSRFEPRCWCMKLVYIAHVVRR